MFLDVLFPLNVSKVIYVDSDQTIRGDLAELWQMDIKGRPYAYTPFCSSRKETLGILFFCFIFLPGMICHNYPFLLTLAVPGSVDRISILAQWLLEGSFTR